MDEKITIIDEKDLEKVAGGEEGDLPQIRLVRRDGSMYNCPNCGGVDFWVVGQDSCNIQIRCMRCNFRGQVPQNM